MTIYPGLSGQTPVRVAAFRTANSPRYLSAAFAAYRSGRVVMALPRGIAPEEVEGVRALSRESFSDEAGWFDERLVQSREDVPAQISFSSGTTGRPKALLLSHRALADVVERINAAMAVDEGIREYIGVPVTFSFGFGRARAVAAAGGRSFLPGRGFDPAEIARMLEAGAINAVSAVPTQWRMVLANPGMIGGAGRRVRWIEIGSQYMSGEEKAAMKRLFPNARIVQHYGLTEASRTTLLDISATEGARLESVGRATGTVELGIGAGGEIRIRGPHLASGRVTAEGVLPITAGAGWLTTFDRGRIEDGWLYYEGRTDELINCGGIKIDPARFEQRLGERLGAPGAVAAGRIDDPLRGECVLVVRRRDSGVAREALVSAATEIADSFGLGAAGLLFREAEDFPRTSTGKIQRARLAEAAVPPAEIAAPEAVAAGGLAAVRVVRRRALEVLGLERRETTALAVFQSHFPGRDIHPAQSYVELGGDSLTFLGLSLSLEETLGTLPEHWERLPIRELERLCGTPGRLRTIETATLLRALSIFLVVAGHFGFIAYGGGGAYALMAIAGFSFAVFQLPAVVDRGRVRPILWLAAKVAALTVGYTAVLGVFVMPVSPHALLLHSNWIDPGTPGALWFIEVYVQLLLALGLLFLVPPVRTAFARQPFRSWLVLLGAGIALAFTMQQVWDTHHLYRRLPHMMLWMFALGGASQAARSALDRLVLTAMLGLGALLWNEGMIELRWFPAVILLLIWVPGVPVLRSAKRLLTSIAGASLFIYLSHFQAASLVQKLGGGPGLKVVAALAIGVIMWLGYERALGFARIAAAALRRASEQRSSARAPT